MNKRALICGVTGQDGAYLTQFLLEKGYEVIGTSRNPLEENAYNNLSRLGIQDNFETFKMAPDDLQSVRRTIKRFRPDEIYFLAGQSSVGRSFEHPVETIQSNTLGVCNILEVMKTLDSPPKLYCAGSGECFGDTLGDAADETMPFSPSSPYAVAKASAYWLVNNYRQSYQLFACTGILFNHESPLRPKNFVTQKIISGAKQIADGEKEKLHLGRLDIYRDWGWAPEYVEAMWLMLQQDDCQDYVVATGEMNKLESFVQHAFSYHSLDWRDHVVQNPKLWRPSDHVFSRGNPSKVKAKLGWSARYHMADVVQLMSREIS